MGWWINLLFTCFPCCFQGIQGWITLLKQHTKDRYTDELSGLDPENCLNSSSSILNISVSQSVTSEIYLT